MEYRIARDRDGATCIVFDSSDGPTLLLDISASAPALRRHCSQALSLIEANLVDSRWIDLIQGGPVIAEAFVSIESFVSSRVVRELEGVGFCIKTLDLLAPPIPAPESLIYSIGANFADHMANIELALGRERPDPSDVRLEARRSSPPGFIVLPGIVVGHGGTVKPPTGVRYFDYEGEIAVVVSTGGRNLSPDEVRLWSVAPWNDLSIRDGMLGGLLGGDTSVPVLHKNFETGKALGPWFNVGFDEEADLDVKCSVNGEVRQHGSMSDANFGFCEVISYVSRYLPIRPGDVFTSGSPAGTALEQGLSGHYLQPGDVIETSVNSGTPLQIRVAEW